VLAFALAIQFEHNFLYSFSLRNFKNTHTKKQIMDRTFRANVPLYGMLFLGLLLLSAIVFLSVWTTATTDADSTFCSSGSRSTTTPFTTTTGTATNAAEKKTGRHPSVRLNIMNDRTMYLQQSDILNHHDHYYNNNKKNEKNNNIIVLPGTNVMFSGFDRLHMTSTSQIFTGSYDPSNPSNIWNPFGTSLNYLVADQLSVNPMYESASMFSQQIFMSVDDIIKTSSSGFNLDVSYGNVTGAYKHEVDTFDEKIRQENKASSFGSYNTTAFEIFNAPVEVQVLSKNLNLMAKMMPTHLDTPQARKFANDMLLTYGTDMVNSVKMGARMDYSSFIDQTFVKHYSSEWINNQASLQIAYSHFTLFPGGHINHSQIHMNEDWMADAQGFSNYFGGNPIYQNDNCTTGVCLWEQEWLESVIEFPVGISWQLSSLAQLMPTPEQQAAMQQAIDYYVQNKKLLPV